MKRLMLATTALFALSGVSVAAADISISGNIRFHYDAWSDDKVDTETESGNNNNSFADGDMQLWIKGTTVTDSGLTYSAEVRFRDDDKGASNIGANTNVDRRYLTIGDDWGKITLGRQWAPSYSMSLGQDWRGTISYGGGDGVARDSGLSTDSYLSASTSGRADKIIYQTPDIGGFKAGISFADAGKSSKANSTEYAVNYSLTAFGDGKVRFGYAAAQQSAKDNADASTETDKAEYGVEVSTGRMTVSVIQFTKEDTPNNTTAAKVSKQKGQEAELAYKVSDSLTLNVVYLKNEVEESATHKDDDYKSTAIGAKYTIAPGLYTSLGYKNFDYTDASDKTMDNSGNTIRVRVHASF